MLFRYILTCISFLQKQAFLFVEQKHCYLNIYPPIKPVAKL